MTALKGQNLRVFVGGSVVAESTNCTITLTGNTQEASTKDDTGMASKPAIVSKSWQVTVDSLDVSDIATLLTAIKSATVFTLAWDTTSSTDNVTPESTGIARSGSAYLTDATFTFNDREYATKNVQFTGSGALS